MDRAECVQLQRRGVRVEEFRENCPACGRDSTYRRQDDRYRHNDGSDNIPCWVAITSGREKPELVVSQHDSPERDDRVARPKRVPATVGG